MGLFSVLKISKDKREMNKLKNSSWWYLLLYCFLLCTASTFMNKLCSSLETECWTCSTKAPAERDKITRSTQTHTLNKPLTAHSRGRGLTCHSAHANQMHVIETSQRRGEIMNLQNRTYSQLCGWLKEQRGKSKQGLCTIVCILLVAFKRQISGRFHRFTRGLV